MIVSQEDRSRCRSLTGFSLAVFRLGSCLLLSSIFLHASARSRVAVAQSPLAAAPSVLHGPISGSQANTSAEHPIANLLNRVSETNPLGIELFGYWQQGVTLNPDSPNDRTNGPVLNNYRSNAYQMVGVYLVAERKVNPDCGRIQLGGRIDTLYGTDAAFGLSQGLDEKIVSDEASRFYKLAFPQIYANLFLPIGPGFSCKIGHFFSPVGNEWLYNTENFFYSHFLSWNIQPGTHTGLLVETELMNSVEVRFGPNFGWNTSQDSNDSISWLASLDWKSPDQRSEIYFAIQTGRQREVITVADSNVTVYSLIINQDLGDRWHYQLEHDLLTSRSRTGTTSDNFESYSIANYLFYNFNKCWRGGLRVEWFRDDDGMLAGFDPTRPAAPGSFYNLTLGLNWHPREHLRIRPEIRHDWQVRDSNTIPPAFDDGTSTNQWLLACDLLFEF